MGSRPGRDLLFRLDSLDEPGRIAAHNGHGFDIVRHDAVGAYDCPVADTHAGEDRSVDAYPDLVLDNDGTSVSGAAVVRIGVVVDGNQVHFRSDEHTVADGNTATVEECASLLNPTTFTDADVLAEIHVERG